MRRGLTLKVLYVFPTAHPNDRFHRPGHGQRCTLLTTTGPTQPRRMVKAGLGTAGRSLGWGKLEWESLDLSGTMRMGGLGRDPKVSGILGLEP